MAFNEDKIVRKFIILSPDEIQYYNQEVNDPSPSCAEKEGNLVFSDASIEFNLDFTPRSCDKVSFKNCRLIGPGTLLLRNVKHFEMVDCEVSNFVSRFTEFGSKQSNISYVRSIFVKGCKFINCSFKTIDTLYGCIDDIDTNPLESGSVFCCYGNYPQEIVFENNIFENCCVEGISPEHVIFGFRPNSPFPYNALYNTTKKLEVKGNTFIDCNGAKKLIYNFNAKSLVDENNDLDRCEQGISLF